MEIFLVAVVISKVVTFADGKDDILKIVAKAGYSGEFSEITTEDDYVLGVHKISSKIQNATKYPVFLMHGFLTTPMSFFLTHETNSLPLILADSGHDVFLGSRRGTKYSTKHLHLSTESREFWDFDSHEIGHFDHKAIIDFVLASTGIDKIYFVGYSQVSVEKERVQHSRT
jgi:pimeloyl-ACP methyl ester carboxylesterase